ncbi:hypothetical protein LI90_4337 (plasmid) [Carbonactinospora thermoautotrophica]|uniref:Lipoprotein n=1 Tax=Carbonactinospora thermoautotrophica TaxID=1469144 RepID=A0A132MHX3_9ACTN|nr:hypothetical protein [Carbonactinospora thermoautotrophica]KWW97365.1 hypothetical protein LI90_4337 [Carbonactinospora thermoautotrophica]
MTTIPTRTTTLALTLAAITTLAGCTGTSETATVRITADPGVCWTGTIGDSTKEGCGPATITGVEGIAGVYAASVQKKTPGTGRLRAELLIGGKTVDTAETTAEFGAVMLTSH